MGVAPVDRVTSRDGAAEGDPDRGDDDRQKENNKKYSSRSHITV
jgi:hypothetical protein